MSHSAYQPTTRLGRIVNEIEETAIAIILALMTVITFVNVVLRYGFNSSLIWGLEVVGYLFAWLVIFGVSYGVKTTSHLGVDAVTNMLPKGPRKVLALLSGAVCIVFAFLLMKGAWDYWAPFAGLDATSGRWFPTGFANSRDQAFYMTEQIPMPGFLKFLEDAMNYGDEYDKLPRFIVYAMLPFGVALTLFRFIQATYRIAIGKAESLIVSHEAEDAVEEAAAKLEWEE